MAETMLFGLTPRQIARLAAWHEEAFGWLHLPNASAVIILQREWQRRWNCMPDDSIVLLGMEQPAMNHAWAWKAILAAANSGSMRDYSAREPQSPQGAAISAVTKWLRRTA